jgi:hypothetical protein
MKQQRVEEAKAKKAVKESGGSGGAKKGNKGREEPQGGKKEFKKRTFAQREAIGASSSKGKGVSQPKEGAGVSSRVLGMVFGGP